MVIYNSNFSIFYSSLINDGSFFSGFSTKVSGDARDMHTIINFFNFNKILYKKIIVLGQIHSVNIHFYDAKNNNEIQKIDDVDGIITNQKNTILVVRNADCLPLIFVDKQRGLIGISHQGWRGTLKKMAIKMVDMFIARGSKKEHLRIALGPAIGACCYDISDDWYYEFMSEFYTYEKQIFYFNRGKRHLNLSLLNYLQLQDVGIEKSQIDFFPFCTQCDKKRFFSFRRSQGKRNKGDVFGDMFSFITFNLGLSRLTFNLSRLTFNLGG